MAKFEKKMKKADKIAMIKQMAEVQIPAQIKVCQANPADAAAKLEYDNMVVQMTMLITETVIGATTVTEKNNSGQWHYKFNQKLCTIGELNEICNILEAYIDKYETPYAENDEEDMGIPRTGTPKLNLDKLNGKTFSAAVVNQMRSSQCIDRAMIMELTDYAEKLRKKQNFQKTLIIAGIAIVIIGGTVTGMYLYNKKHEDGSDVEIDEADIPTIDEADIPTIDEEDIPTVELAE